MTVGGGGSVETIGVAVVVLAYLVYRQLRPRRLNARSLAVFPLIVLFFIGRSLPGIHPSPARVLQIGIDVVVSLVLGLLAARQLEVYADPQTGTAMARGSLTYFLWWLGAFVIKALVAVLIGETATSLHSAEVLIPLFLLLATRNAYLYWKARSLGLAVR